jgi:hypothetical protein
MRPQALHADQHDEARRRHRQGERGSLRQVQRERQGVVKEAGFVDMQPQELGQLVEHDHQADAGLEAGQHRR